MAECEAEKAAVENSFQSVARLWLAHWQDGKSPRHVDHIELQLAHAPRNAVSAAYNHALYLEPRAKMMQGWADYLEQTQRGVRVLPFRGSAA